MDQKLPMPLLGEGTTLVTCKNGQGLDIRATVLRLTQHSVVFEMYDALSVLRTSEVLTDFKIVMNDCPVYSGKAVVSNLMNTGSVTICEVSLKDPWFDLDFSSLTHPDPALRAGFEQFLHYWQKTYRILPEYKLVIADMHSFLADLRSWLEQVELGIRSLPDVDRLQAEREAVQALSESTNPVLNSLFERFEGVAGAVDEDLKPAHRTFCQRQLHSLLLSSPFMHRIYSKPLGYAGDYEMMNMIWRNDYEGSSLFAKILNAFILDQAPAHSVRNRVEYMRGRIMEETLRVVHSGRIAHIFSLGCGPAREVENFFAHPLADQAQFRLLDFNEETLTYVDHRIDAARRTHLRATPVKLLNKSVHHLLKEAGKPGHEEQGYDLIYSSGLYDYLSDRICKTLNTCLYDKLAPGGILIVSNFDPCNPLRNLMESAFEWFLVYRNGKQMAALAPEQISEEACLLRAEPTGCNVFLEIRKPLSKK